MARDTDTALMLRIEASLRQFERQMARARQVGGQAARGIQNDFDRTNQRLAQGSTRAAGALSGVMNVSKQGRFVLQNTAAQIGDIAIQLEQGTNGFRVMGQQIPQILGGFGALGGTLGVLMPLLSTIVAIGAPLAAVMWATGRNSDAAASDVETLTGALAAFNQLADVALSDTSDLRDEYGALAEDIRAAARAATEASAQLAALEVAGAVGDLGADLRAAMELAQQAVIAEARVNDLLRRSMSGEALEASLDAARATAAAYEQSARAAAAEFGLLPEQAEALADALNRVGRANGMDELARSALDAVQLINDMRVSAGEIPPELAEMQIKLDEVARVSAAAAENARQLADSSGRVNFSAAVSQTAQLAQNLGLSLRAAQLLASVQNPTTNGDRTRGIAGFETGDPRSGTGPIFTGPTRTVTNFVNPADRAFGGGRGGGGGGSAAAAREVSQAMQAVAQIIGQVARESITLEDVQAGLNAELAAGRINADEYAQAMSIARERFGETNDELKSMGDLLADMAVNWDRAGDIAVSALRRITQQLLSRAFTQGLERLAAGPGGGGSIIGTIAAGLFGGARAAGGPVASGKAYLVGEEGPELFVPGRSGQIVPNGGSAAALTAPRMAGGPGVTFNQTINNTAAGEVEARTETRQRADGGIDQIVSIVKRKMAEGEFDGSLRRFGVSPQRTRR